MIQAWWDSSTLSHFNKHHDYEQSVVRGKWRANEGGSKLVRKYGAEIHPIIETVREYNRPPESEKEGFFRHITKKANGTRSDRMEAFMELHGIEPLSNEAVSYIQGNDNLFTKL